jgi:AraC-like DNA-binding protein
LNRVLSRHFGGKPFWRQNVVASTNPDLARTEVGRRLKDHSLDVAGAVHSIDSYMNELRLKSVSLFYLRYGAEVLIDPGPFDTFHIIHINVGGSCDIVLDGSSCSVAGPRAAFCSPDQAALFRWKPDSEVVGIKVPCDALDRHYQDLTGLPLQGRIRFDQELDLESEPGRRMVDLLQFIESDAARPRGMWSSPAGAAQLEGLVLSTILLSQAGSHHSLVNPPVSPAAPHYVRKAEAFMHAHLEQPLKLDQIAAHIGVSARSLTGGFRRFRGTSPMAYFNTLRLEAVRNDLLSARPGTTVAEVARRWGFGHLGAFAGSYRRRFGALPAETLRKAI